MAQTRRFLMRYTDLIQEMPQLDREEIGMGLETMTGEHITLFGGMRSGNSPANETRLKFIMYSNDILDQEPEDQNEAKIGIVELFVEDGTAEILGLVNIKIDNPYKSQGFGEKIITDLVDSAKGGELRIHDVNTNSRARKFWNKMGIQWLDGKRKKNGVITKGNKPPVINKPESHGAVKLKGFRGVH
jgi:hypothetical protein